MSGQKGFTIIELIIIIVVIALMAAIILINVVRYIGKSKDAAIIQSVNTLSSSSMAYYEQNGSSFSGFCSGIEFQRVSNAVAKIAGVMLYCWSLPYNISCDDGSWVICSDLSYNTGSAYCIDSTGVKKEISSIECGSLSRCSCPESLELQGMFSI